MKSAALTAQYGESFRPAYGYDAAGRRTSMSTRDYNAAYTYDDLDRLTAAAYSAFQDKPGGTITHAMIPDEDFTYDKNGNRTALLKDPGPGQGEDVSVSYTHDAPVNRLTSDGAWTYLFDHNGNVVRKRSIADPAHLYDDFHYNFQNKLVRHVAHRPGISASGITTEYAYDPLGRRILKLTSRTGNPNTAQHFAYDGDDARLDFATAYDTADNTYKTALAARYTNGPGVDQPLAIWFDADGDDRLEPYFYHADALGSITALTAAASGDIVAKYAYDAFGSLAQKCGAPASPGRTALVDYNRYRYTSREYDGETRLYYYRARWYATDIGGLYQEDPKWALNLYSYSNSNPLMFHDPFGKQAQEVKKVINDSLFGEFTLESFLQNIAIGLSKPETVFYTLTWLTHMDTFLSYNPSDIHDKYPYIDDAFWRDLRIHSNARKSEIWRNNFNDNTFNQCAIGIFWWSSFEGATAKAYATKSELTLKAIGQSTKLAKSVSVTFTIAELCGCYYASYIMQ